MYCRHCGQKLPEGSRFCGRCGRPVDGPVLDVRPGPALTGYAGVWPALLIGLAAASFLTYLISSFTVESFAGEQTYHLVFPDPWPPILAEEGRQVEWAKSFTLPIMLLILAVVIAGAVKRQKPWCFWGSLMGLYVFTGITVMVMGPTQAAGDGLYAMKGQPVAMTFSMLAYLALLILSILSPKGIRHLSKGWLLPTAVCAAAVSVLGQISGLAYSGGPPVAILLSLLCATGLIAAAVSKKHIACIITAILSLALQCISNLDLLQQADDAPTYDIVSYSLLPMFSILACIAAAILALQAYRRQRG